MCDGARYAPEPNVSTRRDVASPVLEELLEKGESLAGGQPAPDDEERDRHPLVGGGEGAVEPRLTGETARHQHEPLDLLCAKESQLECSQAAGIGGDDRHPVEPDSFEEILHPGGDVRAVGGQVRDENAEARDELLLELGPESVGTAAVRRRTSGRPTPERW